ncbi:MAG: hypothetical protein LBQ86_04600 [Holophagales bacterium]|jgi:hypothetical protein|nr:hypothetical protein [Holophagales bacterium]
MHPLVKKFINNELPGPMAAMLIGGGLPLPTGDLLLALSHAVFKESPLAGAALETFKGLPGSIVMGAIADRTESPEPLGLTLLYRSEPELLEAALLNKGLTAEWMERVIPALPESCLDIALNNQVLWIERPGILDALESHPEGTTNLKRRITEFRKDVLGQLDSALADERLEILDEVESGALDKSWAELPLPKEEAAGTTETIETVETIKTIETTPPEPEQAAPVRSVGQRIMRLATNQKIILALKGGKEERSILMREANRLIQVNVVLNGRVTEGEIAYIAQMRTAHEEVIRIIANNREWMRKYPIVKNLASNPRTPLPIAMNLLKRINEFDLKLMSKDRNVAESLRREAKRLVDNKAAGKG